MEVTQEYTGILNDVDLHLKLVSKSVGVNSFEISFSSSHTIVFVYKNKRE